MKNIILKGISLGMLTLILLSSCSKERRFNDVLEGVWKVVSINEGSPGELTPAGWKTDQEYEFIADKKSGIFYHTSIINGDDCFENGKYEIIDDRIIMTGSSGDVLQFDTKIERIDKSTFDLSLIPKKITVLTLTNYNQTGIFHMKLHKK